MSRHSVSVFARTVEGEWRRDGEGGRGRGFVVVVKFLSLESYSQRRRNKPTTCAASHISPSFKLRSTCQSVTAYPIRTETYRITIRSSGGVSMGAEKGEEVGGWGTGRGGGLWKLRRWG